MNKNTLKSIGAVFAGIIIIVFLSVLTDIVLETIGFFPPAMAGLFDPVLLLIALAYRTLYAFFGGYITAKLAPNNPEKLVKILLVIGTVMGLLGVFAGWNLSQHWYPISLVISSGLAVWYGGKYGMKGK